MSEKNLNSQILEFLAKTEETSPDFLAKQLFVSPSTIRRRLSDLERKGLVKRTHGRVKINSENNFVQSFTFRKHQNGLQKKRIALEAVKLIKNGDVIFLDSSSSAYFIAHYLDQFENLRVITNGIDTLSLLAQHKISGAYSTGGKISGENPAALVGDIAEETIKNIHADICFFSAQTIDGKGVIRDILDTENSLRRRMMENSSKTVFLCDSTKFNKTSSFSVCELKEVDCMVCDSLPDENMPHGNCKIILCPAIFG